MEGPLAVAFVMLMIVVGNFISRTNRLKAELDGLRTDMAIVKRRLQLLESGETPQQVANVEQAVIQRGAPADVRPAVAAAIVEPPSPPVAVEAASAALQEAAPELGMAALMARDLAARSKRERVPVTRPQRVPASRPERPSFAERAVARARTTGEWEALIGGNWLNRIGAVALILGVAFFLKYAFDKDWIAQSARIGIGLVLGGGLLALARRTHGQGYAIFAQGLVGAGLAVLYLSVYASYNFYGLVPAPVALAGMVAVTAIAFEEALSYGSLAVALLAWGGGFLTPFLLGPQSGTEVGVIAYVVLLDVGVIGIVLRRDSWVVLEPLSLAATYAVYLTWFVTSYSGGMLVVAGVTLSLFWAVFYVLDIWRIFTAAPSFRAVRQWSAGANTAAYYGLMFALVYPESHLGMGLISLAVGATYISTILLVHGRLGEKDGVDARFTLTALALLAIATGVLTAGFVTVMLWSLEALALLWTGARERLPYVWWPALTLYGMAALLLPATRGALAYTPARSFVPVANLRDLAFLTLVGVLALGTVLARRLQDRYSAAIETSLHYGWCGVALVLLTVETNDIFRRVMAGAAGESLTALGYARFLAIAAVWMAVAIPLVWLGLRRRVLPILTSGLLAAVLSVCLGAAMGAEYQPIERFVPVLNIRAALLLALIGGLAVLMRRIRTERELLPWLPAVVTGLQAAIVLIGFELITAEANDYFRHAAGMETQTAHDVGLFVELTALAVMWMAYSLVLVWNGVRRTSRTLLLAGIGSAGLAIGAAGYIGFAPQPASRLPLVLGTRAVMMPALIAALFLHMRWMRDGRAVHRWLDGVLVAFQAAIVLLGFDLVTGETRDFFDRLATTTGTPGADNSGLRNLEQLTLSVLWLLYAIVLMGIGIWRRTRWLRVGAFALFGFIILKIFIYDLSFLQNPYRSVSFAGLGLILLAVSYLYQRYRALLLDPA